MARLNMDLSPSPSPPPRQARSTTLDSLYRDPTPASRLQSSAQRDATYSVFSPAPSNNSDKENVTPAAPDDSPRPMNKGKRPMAMAGARQSATPGPASATHAANKRRRTGDYSSMLNSTELDTDHGSTPVPLPQGSEDFGLATPEDDADDDEETEKWTKFYDPHQNPDIRRQVRANIRQNHREMEENRDSLIRPDNNDLLEHIKRSNMYMDKVRQTADALMDSRSLVTAADLASKKMNNSVLGNNGVGLDVDQFVSKCITFMKSGGRTANDMDEDTSTQARSHRRRTATQHDDEDDESPDGLDWAVLGAQACFPFNKRPPVPCFLLGPLSVQRRARATQTRRARQQRQPVGPATRPQELQQEDIQQSENTNLTHLVKTIKTRLEAHLQAGSNKIEAELAPYGDDVDEETIDAACRRHRVYQSPEQDACVSLFDFAVNPKSFGQTVENLFYVSFLIREGNVKVLEDQHGLPLLVPSQPHSLQEQREQSVQKHQAVFTLDWPTWKMLIDAFDIKEPLIPHRVAEETNVAAGAWYG